MTKEEAININKKECYAFNPYNIEKTTVVNTALDMAIKALEKEPCTVDAKLIVHAHWIKGIPANITCSNCDFTICTDGKTCQKLDYCPHCGAKMDE